MIDTVKMAPFDSSAVETRHPFLHCDVCGPFQKHHYLHSAMTHKKDHPNVIEHLFTCETCGTTRKWGEV